MNLEIIIDIPKLCRICGLEGKFEPKRWQCSKCISKKRYDSNYAKGYYAKYYENNKEAVLKQQKKYYENKKIKNTLEN
jgi:hypothetical protein